MNITFFVQGIPKPQPRPRAFARNLGGGKYAARVFDPGTAEGWKAQVALAARPYIPANPHDGALCVSIAFWFERPVSHKTSKGRLRDGVPVLHQGKPDLDNLAKSVLDCLTQIGMWRDDAQIVALTLRKEYAERGGAEITIRSI